MTSAICDRLGIEEWELIEEEVIAKSDKSTWLYLLMLFETKRRTKKANSNWYDHKATRLKENGGKCRVFVSCRLCGEMLVDDATRRNTKLLKVHYAVMGTHCDTHYREMLAYHRKYRKLGVIRAIYEQWYVGSAGSVDDMLKYWIKAAELNGWAEKEPE